MRTLAELPPLTEIPVLVRGALNVPLDAGSVLNDYRLRRAIPTLKFLIGRGARVVLVSHIGQAGTETLEPVAHALGRLMPSVSFCPETIGEKARAAIRAMLPGTVLVLENLRRHKGETTNDPLFARELASLADVFVQDSFDTCHRLHASIVGVPKILPSYAGLLVEDEVRELSKARAPEAPALAVIGGAKFTTKEAVLTTLLERYDHLVVGGALANDFLKLAGQEVGKSYVSPDADEGTLRRLLANPKVIVPLDSLVIPYEERNALDAPAHARVAGEGQVRPDEMIIDHGPSTVALISKLAQKARTILWNGPLGIYESGFVGSTDAFAKAVASSGAHSIVGGGDTVASIENLGLLPKFSFVSTGGGAMLDFLAAGTLPGIAALTK